MPPIVEVNGYDESGIIGKNLRFVRVAMTVENSLRPFVYNLLHFRSVSATKRFLEGMPDTIKKDYVRMVLTDPAITTTQYSFSTDHQIDILRKFTLLEEKSLFYQRTQIVDNIRRGTYDYEVLKNIAQYIKRYERVPFWMESFIKSYAFRMIVEDLINTSKVVADRRNDDYKAISYVDGGFPFVFWWREFLEAQSPTSRFSLQKTPIYGVTKGDEYYPTTSMAGNIAFITSTTPGMVYPHNIIELPRMDSAEVNGFYNTFSQTTSIPTFHKRVLFVGSLSRDFQYLLPFILHLGSEYRFVYEPFRLHWKMEGSLRSFYRTFGKYPENDLVITGAIRTEQHQDIYRECCAQDLDCQDAGQMLDIFDDLLNKIEEQSQASNLSVPQRRKISQSIIVAKQQARASLQ